MLTLASAPRVLRARAGARGTRIAGDSEQIPSVRGWAELAQRAPRVPGDLTRKSAEICQRRGSVMQFRGRCWQISALLLPASAGAALVAPAWAVSTGIGACAGATGALAVYPIDFLKTSAR